MAPKTIALVICSTRKPRIGPSIASWLTSVVAPHVPSDIAFKTIDLANYPVPISPSGPTIPAQISVPLSESPYEDEQVNTWSQAVRQIDAFVFLTPQYNWSIPGVLKVALDHLFHEWAGKPMMLVTYGGHGGGKCALAMREVWKGLRGGECVGGVELTLGEGIGRAIREGGLDVKVREAWEGAAKDREFLEGWGRLISVVGKEKS